MRGLDWNLLLLVTSALFCLSLLSYDSGGSNGSPEWVGNWEVTGYENIEDPDTSQTYISFTEQELDIIMGEKDGCVSLKGDILEVDSGVITFDPEFEEEGPFRWQMDVSGSTLTITVLEGENDQDTGNKVILESVDSDPRELAGCQ